MDEQFPRDEVETKGYKVATYGQKTYNGVAFISKGEVQDIERGLSDLDPQARVIAATFQGVRVVNVYAPNGQSIDSEAYQYKLKWYETLREWLLGQAKYGPLVVCGDFNVAPHDIDVWDPSAWVGQVLVSDRERAALGEVLARHQLVDLFREKHGPSEVRYSWWDYRALGFPKNHGLRIDHILTGQTMVDRCVEVDVDRDMRKGKLPSDHAPVWAQFRD